MIDIGVYYFGCWSPQTKGHHLYGPSGRTIFDCDMPLDFPLREGTCDGGLLPPRQPQVQGRAALWSTDGWSLLTFWDRSADSRFNCNSTFIARGSLDRWTLLEEARRAYPSIFARFTFPIDLGDAPSEGKEPRP